MQLIRRETLNWNFADFFRETLRVAAAIPCERPVSVLPSGGLPFVSATCA